MNLSDKSRSSPEFEAAADVVRRLRSAGFEAMFAGGCVRDLLTGKTPKDFDVATSARPDDVEKQFRRTIAVGKAFGVVRVERKGFWFEVATFRKDGPYEDGRRPDSVVYSSAAEDAARRDFTINALFLDPESGEVVDYVDGRKDVEARVVRCVGEPRERFGEDALRLLRAVRFASAAGFRLEDRTLAAVIGREQGLRGVAPERVREEFEKIAARSSAERAEAVRLLFETGLVRDVFGDAAPTNAEAARRIAANTPTPGLPAFLAALTFERFDATPAAATARALAEELSDRLRLSNDERKAFGAATVERRRILGLHRATAARRRLWATRDDLPLHRELLAATGDAPEALAALDAESAKGTSRPPPLLDGGALMALGAPKGPALGRLMRRLRILQLSGRAATRAEAEAAARALIARG